MKDNYFLKTERLGFSHWSEQDLPLAFSLWGNKDVSRFISKGGVFSDEEIQNKLATEIKNQKEYGIQYWPVFELSGGKFIGCCGLRLFGLRTQSEQGVYEIGTHIKSEFWGKGLALEAAKRVIDYAFDDLCAQLLFAGHNPNNVNSKKVLEKLGFEYVYDSFYPPTGLMHPCYTLKKPCSKTL